jgi:hypothetical protein
VQPDLEAVFLVDFGLSELLRARSSPQALTVADRAGLQHLSDAVTARPQPPM